MCNEIQPEVGQIIKSKSEPQDTYHITKIGTMIEYSGAYGEGEVLALKFHSEFEITQASAIVKVSVLGVDCPHCATWIDGFVSDPRGSTITCDSCSKLFTVDPIEVEF